MASPSSDPATPGPEAAPLALSLAVDRLARFTGVRAVANVGPAPLRLEGDFELTAAPAEGGIVVAAGDTSWDALGAARIAVVADLGRDRAPFDAIAAAEERAAAAGWRIAHAGLLHTGATGARREGSLLIACRPEDSIAEALACGPLGLALDPRASGTGFAPRPARVLIASHEVAGPTGNGGIGTAYHSLAHTLAAAGHDVTMLFTGWLDPEQAGGEPEWRRSFAQAGIDFQLLGTPWDVPVRNPHHQVRRAYELHRWLTATHATRPFDVVHAPETPGHAAFALMAKRLGSAYRDVEFVIGTHSSTRWVAESNREGIEQLDDLVSEQLERTSVELADVVMSPTAYMLEYMRGRGWSLPERTFVQPLARPRAVRELAGGRPTAGERPTRQLVFFGRLETRKGLEAFCDAVDLLTAADDCPFERVTLLGRPEPILGTDATSYVTRRAAGWGLDWRILPDLGHDEAVAHLRDAAGVVAIPSLVDNSPNTVIETVALGVPFVASRSGGTGELIAAADLASSTFDGWRYAGALEPPTFSDAREPFDVEALATALRAKAFAPAAPVSPSVDDAACDSAYDGWHRAIAGRPRDAAPAAPGEPLTAAVCIVARDRAAAARVGAAVASGTRAPTWIVAIVEEPGGDSLPGLDSVVVASDRDAGQARRRVNAELDADVLIVLRGNEEPDPELVERTLDAMRTGGAELLSLVTRDHDADRPTDTPEHLRRSELPRDLCAFVPIAGPAVAGALYPAFCVGPYAIRRSALSGLGGYAADAPSGAVDRELLSRAALDGVRMHVFPDPLASVVEDDEHVALRAHYWGSTAVPSPRGEEQISLLRPFRRQLGESLADLPALLTGTLRVAGGSAERARDEAARRDEIVAAYEARLTEHRELIELYERQKEELRAALGSGGARSARPGPESPGQVLAWRVRQRIKRLGRRLR
ncbi:glycosyltransferase family 4 protein [Conexibacter woesei]|uniref:Glycosyltransferase-like protein n=1 Tax=Conexibacter woesei (strain DSM 14684 / CCUG 47730 / CIP 108061 / JCM 11494 / NBRC 100937 / ID131577) TaxID=469383 RepID=D3EZP8_CONWI|nr:glycosyltransferase family 4 protein [Conexibacter woesei]ADB53886.1 Glycosyltransferase-like protein [Conexibacter woesei DSM 14684]